MEKDLEKAFKENKIDIIVSLMILDTGELTLKDKVNLMIKNLCVLKPRTIEHLIPLFRIKYDFGSPMSLYSKSVECSPEVFGFVNAYYSPTIIDRKRAYTRALFLNKTENMKKIKGIDSKTLKDLQIYVEKKTSVSDLSKKQIKDDYKFSKSKKDTSPEDFLKRKLSHSVKKSLRNKRFIESF